MKAGLREHLLSTAATYSERPALWVDDRHYTYQQLFARASRLAELLETREESFCILYCQKNLTRYVAILASVLAGKVFVPICPTSVMRHCEHVISQVGEAIYILDSGEREREELLLGRVPASSSVITTWPTERGGGSLLLQDLWPNLATDIDFSPYHTQEEHQGAYVMFTSGSTGVPKAVLVTRQNLSAYIAGATALFHPTAEDRFAQVNNYTFDLSMHDIFLAWSCGSSVYAFSEMMPLRLPALLRNHQITFWLLVPTTGQTLANMGLLKPGRLPDLRCTLFCGEPFPQRLAQTWHQAAPQSQIHNIYGPTEATIAITSFAWQPDCCLPEVVPIGLPYPGQMVSVVNEDLSEVEEGEAGELCLGGDQVAPGYYGNPEQTTRRFVQLPGKEGIWYRTGDWVQWDSRWGLLFKGRRDDQLQVRGYRVERLGVEMLLKEALGTDSLAVIGWPVVDGLVQGLVVFIQDSGMTGQQIRRKISQELPEHLWPNQVYILPELPQTRSCKVDYTALKRQLMEPTLAARES